jgi:prepilin-type N-terminal cleavage/methylation domain-containing protein
MRTTYTIMRNRHQGFTLIEVMIVVAIVAIITAVALPNYTEYIRRGHRAEVRANLLQLAQWMERAAYHPGAMTTTAPFMNQALGLAAQALFLSSPNPRVGCVITAPDGRVLGQGFTQQAGGPHAEVMALRDAAAAGQDVRGATAYVTLEPCAHQGRTGPCCDALMAAGVAKVVASLEDPNPLVAARALPGCALRAWPWRWGPGAAESRELNIGFFSRMVRGTPWVRLKVAASLDGTTALPTAPASGSPRPLRAPMAMPGARGPVRC